MAYKVVYFAALLFLIWFGASNRVEGIPGMKTGGRKSLEKALTPTRKAIEALCYGECTFLYPDCENPDNCQCDTDNNVCIPKDLSCRGDCNYYYPECENPDYCRCDTDDEVCIPKDFSCSGDCNYLAPDCYNEEYCKCDEENEVCIPRN